MMLFRRQFFKLLVKLPRLFTTPIIKLKIELEQWQHAVYEKIIFLEIVRQNICWSGQHDFMTRVLHLIRLVRRQDQSVLIRW